VGSRAHIGCLLVATNRFSKRVLAHSAGDEEGQLRGKPRWGKGSQGRSSRVEFSDCAQVLSCFLRTHLRAGSVKRGPVEDVELPSGTLRTPPGLPTKFAFTRGSMDGQGDVTEANQV